MQVTTIGLDIAKHVFQVHGVDGQGKVVLQKRLGRARVLEFSSFCTISIWRHSMQTVSCCSRLDTSSRREPRMRS